MKPWQQFSRFACVGVIGTLAHYATMGGLIASLAASPTAATSVGAVVGALINYALNRRHTFASQRAHRQALPRFLVIAGLGMAINAVIVWSATRLLLWHHWPAQFVATGMVLAVGFLANRAWTFREPAS
jgi:putative flippase GtrA